MINRDSRFKPLVLEIEIEIVDVLGEEHAFIDQRFVAERTDIKARNPRFPRPALNPAAADIQGALQLFWVTCPVIAEHDLFNLRTCVLRFLADDGDINWRLAPTIDVESEVEDFCLNDRTGRFLLSEIGARQEDLPDTDRVIGWLVAAATDLIAEKLLRNLNPDARAVTGLAIGVDSAAVPDVLEGLDAHFYDFTARLPIERCHKSDTAGAMLILRIVGMRIDQALAIVFVIANKISHSFAAPLHIFQTVRTSQRW